MDIDESILISEVARKCAISPNDRETEEFIRRQVEAERRERTAQKVDLSHKIEAGSTMTILERELTKYLLKSGHESVEIREGVEMVSYNIASLIFAELDEGGMEFRDAVYSAIVSTYRAEWESRGEGVEVPTSIFIMHPNPDVCNLAIEILTSDDNYVPSQIWAMKQMRADSDAELMSVGLPKAVMLYKSKVLESMIKEQQASLAQEGLSEDEQMAIIQRLSKFNSAKVQIANKIQRLIL